MAFGLRYPPEAIGRCPMCWEIESAGQHMLTRLLPDGGTSALVIYCLAPPPRRIPRPKPESK
jgi:hypothetical protein